MQFPDGREMVRLLEAAGLVDVEHHPLTFGIATLYVGRKAEGRGQT
jgi:demethylmenaquinone methyltransferase/2-methoxy-6-polyprenyl-1,4-benzoquinol methylase